MKALLYFFSVSSFFLSENISGQITFQKLYQDTAANSFAFHSLQTSRGEYFVTGYKEKYKRTDTVIDCNPFDTTLFDTCYYVVSDYNVFCFLTDEFGDTLWTREHGDTTNNDLGKLAIENSAGFLLICNRNYFATTLIQIDTLGQVLWEKDYILGDQPGYNAHTVDAQRTLDGYIITGNVLRSNHKEDMFLFKVDVNGDSLWLKFFGDSLRHESASAVKIASDFGFVVAGFSGTDSLGNFPDIQLFKADSSGNLLWYKIIGDTAMELANYFEITSDGGFILIGNIANRPLLYRDFYLVKTDPNGDTVWTKRYGLPNSNEYGRSIKQTYDQGYIMTGVFPSLGTIPLLKTDSTGTIEWTQAFNYTAFNFSGCGYVEQTSDSGFLMPGSIDTSIIYGKIEIFLIKTDIDGNATSIKEIPLRKNIKVFPNPFHTVITLEFTTPLHNAEIIIYNVLGIEMLRKNFTGNKIELERRNLESGIYILRVADGDRQYVQKIVVE